MPPIAAKTANVFAISRPMRWVPYPATIATTASTARDDAPVTADRMRSFNRASRAVNSEGVIVLMIVHSSRDLEADYRNRGDDLPQIVYCGWTYPAATIPTRSQRIEGDIVCTTHMRTRIGSSAPISCCRATHASGARTPRRRTRHTSARSAGSRIPEACSDVRFPFASFAPRPLAPGRLNAEGAPGGAPFRTLRYA